MNPTQPTHPARSFWPYGIIIFFVVAVVFLVTFVVWSARQQEDLVTENAYEKGVEFQKQLDQQTRTLTVDAKVAVAYDAVMHNITIMLPAAQAANAVGQIQFYRPSDASLDRTVQLAVNPEGVQSLDVKDLPAGLWKVRVMWTTGGEEYFIDRTVVITKPS